MMADKQDFLVEIGTEELPPKALHGLSLAFAKNLELALADAGLSHAAVRPFASPRRLAIRVDALQLRQPDREVEHRGPPLKVAYDDDGNPTRAATSFAKKCGAPLEKIEQENSGKDPRLIWRGVQKGRTAAEMLPDMVQLSLDQLPIPRRMRWGSGEAEFVRPVHWVLLKLGKDVLDATIFGVRAGRTSRGHRFMAPGEISIGKPGQYESLLEKKGKVIVDFSRRMDIIRKQVGALATEIGGRQQLDEALLEEVAALVEWPKALAARFPDAFLDLPPEVLIATLQDHQRYFPVFASGDSGKLLAAFITVANLDSQDPATIIAGNERVVQARLSDSLFFWQQDTKAKLEDRVDSLKNVIFQRDLGSVHDKSTRTGALAADIAKTLGGDVRLASRAAMLAKCDLLTLMVGEFPELQGIMGRYYALNDGLPKELATALAEQYQPRFAGDDLPETITGRSLAIAEKIDTICGIFAAGQKPSGNKDPFALRRNALGCLRILIERDCDLDLRELIKSSLRRQPVSTDDGLGQEIYDFMMDRLKAYYQSDPDAGISPDMFDAVLARKPGAPLDFHRRLLAVRSFQKLDAAESLAAANKRIANILRKNEDELPEEASRALLREPAEVDLFERLQDMSKRLEPLHREHRYQDSLEKLAELRVPIDTFFDNVLVMDEDADLRGNRLALLGQLRDLFLHTADLSRLQT